ncbi:MAG TPA: hypothetical protein VIT01_05170 [Acidimicrobiales bacterium]
MPRLGEVATEIANKIDEAVSVVVGRVDGGGDLELSKLAVAQDAADGFRDLARACVEDLGTREEVAYTADAELERRQAFVLDDEDRSELSDLSGLADSAATLPVTPPKDLDLRIQFYAVIVGDEDRTVLVRRTDPRIGFQKGRMLALGGERLTRIDAPTFSFSPGFDVLLGKARAVILNQVGFERLFREIGLIEKHVDAWMRGITDHLPMDEESEADLRRVTRDDTRTWRRLREISRRGHLKGVDVRMVARYAKKVGLPPDAIVRGEKLVFDPAERFSFLQLLSEDLYRGPLTDEVFEAQRKAVTGLTS